MSFIGSGTPAPQLGDGDLDSDASVDRDVMVRMPDGVEIACDVYRPNAPGRHPVLYGVSPYLKDSVYLPTMGVYRYRETGNIASWVRRGYVYVHADARGCGKSSGIYERFSAAEQRDLYDMIEWCAAQSWSNGKVGMIGQSYYGIVQWLAAAQNPPHLACIAPYDASTDPYRDSVFKGGIYCTGFQNHWYSNSVRNRAFLDYPDRPDRADFMAYDYLLDQVRHTTFDDYWASRRAAVADVRVPVFSIANWGSLAAHLRGNLEGFANAQGPKKLLVNAGDPQSLFVGPEFEDQLARWYDFWLKGVDTGVMDEAPVRILIRNGDGYRDEQEWPLRRAEYRKLYLRSGPSGAAESLNDGRLSWDAPSVDIESTSYSYPDPAWTFPGIGSAVRGSRGMLHETRKTLTFTSPAFQENTEVTGPLALNIWASSSSTDTQFIVRIVDLPPLDDEVAAAIRTLDVAPPSRLVTEGWLRASHRALDLSRSTNSVPYHAHTAAEPLEPGRIYEFKVEVWPTSWVFEAGHRMQLRVAALDQNGQCYLGHLRAVDTFYHDRDHPSHLLIPVIPG